MEALKKGTQNEGIGKSRGRLTSKIYAVKNDNGGPIKFIITDGKIHGSVINNFFDSALRKFLRRTCELLFDNTQMNRWMHEDRGFKSDMEFAEIESYLQHLLEDESLGKDILNYLYV